MDAALRGRRVVVVVLVVVQMAVVQMVAVGGGAVVMVGATCPSKSVMFDVLRVDVSL